MDKIYDCPELDSYGAKIFGYNIAGTWEMFRNIVKTAMPYVWCWDTQKKLACYPANIEVASFDEFATFLLHETAHGWCHYVRQRASTQIAVLMEDEEYTCWQVSKLICELLGITFQEESAMLAYQFHLSIKSDDIVKAMALLEIMPLHTRN